ncbi:helix-turn-helix transcriptional regulator [Pediococcus acidilactici]
MRKIELSPIKISDEDRSFVLKFSLLEHDIIHFFKNSDFEHAEKHVDYFFEKFSFSNIDTKILKDSLIGFVGGLSAASLFSQLNTISYLELRIFFIDFLNENDIDLKNFKGILMDIVQTFFNYNKNNHLSRVDFKQLSKQVALVAYYINAHKYASLQIDKIFSRLKLDKKYTLAKFRKEMGISLSYYIHYVKISEAKKLLLTTSMPIGKIAQVLKFYDAANFSKEFYKEVGISPRKYRQLNQLH